MIEKIKYIFEQQAFGVCTWWGNKLDIKTAKIRLFFIYASFLTVGSPIILYLIMAFILELKNYFRSRKSRVWDL